MADRVLNDPASDWPPDSFVLTNERVVRYQPGIQRIQYLYTSDGEEDIEWKEIGA